MKSFIYSKVLLLLLYVGIITSQAQSIVPITFFGTNTTQGSNLNQFDNPKGILYAADGRIYVADANNHRISVWTQSGNNFGNVATFGGFGSALGNLYIPSDIAQSADGRLFISDQSNHRISVWNVSGNVFTPLATFGGLGSAANELDTPTGLAITTDGRIFIGVGNSRVSVWTINGTNYLPLATFGGTLFGSGNNDFKTPADIAIDAQGKILVADNLNHRISVWTQSGNNFGNLTTFGENLFGGSELNEFNTPLSIAIDASGKIMVADNINDRISIWTQTGNSFGNLTTFGGIADIYAPAFIATGPNGQLFIGDNLARVSVWQGCTGGITIVTQPTSQTLCGGNMATFTISTTGLVQSYIWSNGASTQSIQTSTVGNYMVTVSGACGNAISNNVSLVNGGVPTQITHFPSSQEVCRGNLATFSVTAVGTNLTYRWLNDQFTDINTPYATTAAIQTTILGKHFVSVTGACGSINNAFTPSNLTTLTSTIITQQPVSQTVCGGNLATISVSADGANLTYLWNNGNTTESIQTNSAGNYTVTVTGTCGTAISNIVSLVINPNITQITTQPTSQTICGGSFATFGVTASGQNLSYLWSNGASTQTIQPTNTGTYSVTVSGTCGNVVSNTAQFTRDPRSTTITGISSGMAVVVPGIPTLSTTSLNVQATGNNLSYQWSNGATTRTVSGVTAGEYFVTVTGTCGIAKTSIIIGNVVLAAENSGYIFKSNFGNEGTANNQFKIPYGITSAPDGKIYVADQLNHRISVWTQSGNTYTPFATFGSEGSANNQFKNPTGITVASDGKIYVADYNNHRISVWTLNGNTYTPFASFGSLGSASNQFDSPSRVTLASDGKIYVADFLNNRISVWTLNGNTYTPFATFGSQGTASNQFNGPCAIDVAPDGKIYVADIANYRIRVWTLNGNTYTPFATFGEGIISNDDFIREIRTSIKVASDGKIYSTDLVNNTVFVWTQSGNNFSKLTSFGSHGNGNAELHMPYDVHVDKKGRILIADKENHRISVWQAPAPIFYLQVTFDITTPTTFTGRTATLTWPTISGLGLIAVKYCIRISKDKSMGTGVKTVCGLTGNSYTYNPNDPNGRTEAGLEEYFWQVAGVDEDGNQSQWSAVQTFSLDATATSTNLPFYQRTKLSISPNPLSNGELKIENGVGALQIYNAQGSVVYSSVITSETTILNLNLAKGIYLVKVGNQTSKLMVE